MKKNKKRTLDRITPRFQVSDETIEKLKLFAQGDPEAIKWMEEQDREYEKEVQEQLERLRQTCLTGKDRYGNDLPVYYINRLKKHYEESTGKSI